MNQNDSVTSLSTYLRLLSYARPYWPAFLLSIFGYLMYAATQPALAQMTEYLVDAVNEKQTDARYWIPLMIMLIYLVRGLGTFLGSYYLAKVSQTIIHDLRCELFARQIQLPASFFDKENSGHLISLITYNVSQVAAAATNAIKVLIREGLTVLGLLAYLLYMNWQLTLLFVVISPLIAVIVSYTGKRFKSIIKNIQLSMGDVTHVTSEAIQSYKEPESVSSDRVILIF